jgi:hypothetical protein
MSFLINSPNHFLRFRSQPPIGSGPPGHPDRRLLSPDAAAPLKAGGYTCALWNAFPVTLASGKPPLRCFSSGIAGPRIRRRAQSRPQLQIGRRRCQSVSV